MPPTGTDEGIQAATILRASRPEVGVIVLSQHLDVACALALLRDGSAGRGYLLKDRLAEPALLAQAVRDVAHGRSCVDPEVVDALVARPPEPAAEALQVLTAREREILALVAQGASNVAIAQRLVISKGAVEKHINAVFAKLGLADDPAASRRVVAALLYLGRVSGQVSSESATAASH
jgi:DNA-binding NarL/FixJ family response regulator